MLLSIGVQKMFWIEAIITAAYLRTSPSIVLDIKTLGENL